VNCGCDCAKLLLIAVGGCSRDVPSVCVPDVLAVACRTLSLSLGLVLSENSREEWTQKDRSTLLSLPSRTDLRICRIFDARRLSGLVLFRLKKISYLPLN